MLTNKLTQLHVSDIIYSCTLEMQNEYIDMQHIYVNM